MGQHPVPARLRPARTTIRCFMIAAAIAVITVSTGSISAAMAASQPSMLTDGNNVNITGHGANNSLRFFWAVNGSSTWHPETVAGNNTTYSAPSMITDGSDVNIAAVGAGNSLRFFWAVNGTNTWHPETVAPKGSMG